MEIPIVKGKNKIIRSHHIAICNIVIITSWLNQPKLSWIIPLYKQLELWDTNVSLFSMWHTMDAISKTAWVAFAMSTDEGAKYGDENEHIYENAH